MKLIKYKHLSFEDRCTIQEYLNYGYNLLQKNVEKSTSIGSIIFSGCM